MEGGRERGKEEAPADARLPLLLPLAYSGGERGEASQARLQLIITLESLPAASRPAHLKCKLDFVSRRLALRSARANAGAGYIGAFIQYVGGTGPAREAPSLE